MGLMFRVDAAAIGQCMAIPRARAIEYAQGEGCFSPVKVVEIDGPRARAGTLGTHAALTSGAERWREQRKQIDAWSSRQSAAWGSTKRMQRRLSRQHTVSTRQGVNKAGCQQGRVPTRQGANKAGKQASRRQRIRQPSPRGFTRAWRARRAMANPLVTNRCRTPYRFLQSRPPRHRLAANGASTAAPGELMKG
jgi:hypothetical protein